MEQIARINPTQKFLPFLACVRQKKHLTFYFGPNQSTTFRCKLYWLDSCVEKC